MKKVLLLLLIAQQGYGQISGKLRTPQGEPVAFANIALLAAADSTVSGGAYSDELGTFVINPEKTGTYFLKIRGIGFREYSGNTFIINTLNTPTDLKTILIEEENSALDEVTIAAKRNLIQVTPLGTVVNVQSSLMTKGSNALQVLERLPGVITDRRNNQFSLNGQSGVTVLLNGRRMQMSVEELMNLLENTAADNIEKIELITSPTAQYDADGGAGIINIVFKNNREKGTNVSLSATTGYGFREKAQTALGISSGYKHLTFNAMYSFLHDVASSGYRGEGTAGANFLIGETSNKFHGISQRFQNTHNLNISLEYQPGTKNTIGSELLINTGNTRNVVDLGGTYDLKSGDFIGVASVSDGKTARQNLIASTYLKRTLSSRSNLNLDLSFINYTNHNPTEINTHYFDREGNTMVPPYDFFTYANRGDSRSKIQVGVFKTDLATTINPKINAEFGLKTSVAQNNNDSRVERKINDVLEIDPRSQSTIASTEYIAAAYAQFKFLLNPANNLHLGMRHEWWQRDVNIYAKPFRISRLFPSVLYTRNITERSAVNFSYSHRITRPAYTDLVSNLFYADPTFVFSGNPLLKPTLTHVLKADYQFDGKNIGLSFQYDLNPILRYQIVSNEAMDIGISAPQNLDFQKSINLFLNYPLEITRWWKLSLGSTTSLRHYKVSYSLHPAEKTFVFQNFNGSQNLQLPRNFEIELSGWYNLPFYEGTNSIKGFGILNMAVAKKLKNDKGAFQLALPDVFRSFSVHTHISGMTPIVFDINTVSNWRDETAFYRVVKLTYSRSFGGKSRSMNNKSTVEEKDRVQ